MVNVSGLGSDTKVASYLARAYGLEAVSTVLPFPVFKKDEAYYVGGYRNFYPLVVDGSREEVFAVLAEAKKLYANFQTLISAPYDLGGRLANYVLDLDAIADIESRFDHYEKKTRNLVRKSYKSNFRCEIGTVPAGFYDLYHKSLERLGGSIKSREWFAQLDQALLSQTIAVSLYDDAKLIGVNYAIFSGDYIELVFNISDEAYWQYASNDRLYDELIVWAKSRGFRYLDFGPSVRTDKSHNHFKAGFGAKMWYLLDLHKGSLWYRFKAFLGAKKYNLMLRLKR